MPTSGTVSTTVFDTRKVIDHAFRRCKMTPQEITSEHIQTAKDLLYLHLSTLVSRGIKLWNVDRIILPLYENIFSVPAPIGTVDILDCNLRTATRQTGTASATEGDADNAFDEDLSTACTQTSVGGSITLELETGISVPIYGILPNASGTWSYIIEGSNDGISYSEILSKTDVSVVAAEWLWEDVEGVPVYTYYRLRATGASTVLDVTELVYQNLPQEIPLYQLNRTDYSNLPNKTRTGRPTQFWWDKQRTQGTITVWPNVQFQFTFAQLTCYIQRYIQDVGTLTEEIEVPQRWYLSVVCSLAEQLGREIKEVDASLIPILERDAFNERKKAWDGESDNSDIFFRPNISPYTR